MMMQATPRTARIARGALVALSLALVAACASKPKYTPAVPVAEAPRPPAEPAPRAAPAEPVHSGPAQPIPGSERDFVINAGDRVYFDFDQFAIRPDGGSVLDAQAAWLGRYRNVRVRIEGNCDERGTREYNFALGARRAQAVRDYLVARGIDAARIDVISYGKERPIDPASNEDAWAHNRNGHTQITAGAR
jgi:peptidoglycan-associated lipoprotein